MDNYQDTETTYEEDSDIGTLEERGEAVREATTLMNDIRPLLPWAGKTRALEDDAKKIYAAGKKFRVIKPGARLEGVVQFGKVRAGYAEALDVGDIITCTGWREGLCGGGVMEANFATETSPTNSLWLQFWPMESLWSPWPLKSFIEPWDENSPPLPEPVIIKEPVECDCIDGMSCEDCEEF